MAQGAKTGGRQKGTRNKANDERIRAIAAAGITPLDYMLKVMRDEKEQDSRRDEMAKAAAPYVHARLAAIEAKVAVSPLGAMLDSLGE